MFGTIVLEHPEDSGNGAISHHNAQGQRQNDGYHQKDRYPERNQDRLTREDALCVSRFASNPFSRLGTLRINR